MKLMPGAMVLLYSTHIECAVFRIFLRMSDHPWKETSSVRAALRCVCVCVTVWKALSALYSTIMYIHSVSVSMWLDGWMDGCV